MLILFFLGFHLNTQKGTNQNMTSLVSSKGAKNGSLQAFSLSSAPIEVGVTSNFHRNSINATLEYSGRWILHWKSIFIYILLSFHSESLNEVLQRKSCDVFGRRKTTAA
jgi:hypothetical protein